MDIDWFKPVLCTQSQSNILAVISTQCCCIRRYHTDHHNQQGCQRHCVDENLERRNHYLDLAGIENYTSRFGTGKILIA